LLLVEMGKGGKMSHTAIQDFADIAEGVVGKLEM
jgi:hypothetical protein